MNLDEVLVLDIVPSSAWTFLVGMRDNFTCQDCGKQLHYMSHELKAHHVIPISKIISDKMDTSLINRLSNGIAVCSQCHANRHNHKANFMALLPPNTVILSNSIILANSKEYIRPNEVCKLAHINSETLTRLDYYKIIPHERIANRKYYQKWQVLQFVELLPKARELCKRPISQRNITQETIIGLQKLTKTPAIKTKRKLPKTAEELLTTSQMAKLLQLNKATILRLARMGQIGEKVGNQWRFKRSEIDNYNGDNNRSEA
jgi:excisionase family DNA binding protein